MKPICQMFVLLMEVKMKIKLDAPEFDYTKGKWK